MANQELEHNNIFIICTLVGVLAGGLTAFITKEWYFAGILSLAGVIAGYIAVTVTRKK